MEYKPGDIEGKALKTTSSVPRLISSIVDGWVVDAKSHVGLISGI
jgi:hypothetical protein